RAVARPASADRTAVHRRFADVRRNQLLPLRTQVGDPAGALRRIPLAATLTAPGRCPEMRPRIVEILQLALLPHEMLEIHRTTVNPGRCAGLEPRHLH